MQIEKHLENLTQNSSLIFESLTYLLKLPHNHNQSKEIFILANLIREKYFGKGILLRGLVEFSNYCKNKCFYCGLNVDNKSLKRYAMTDVEILESAKKINSFGIKTIVLQSGESLVFDCDLLIYVIKKIKKNFDMQITLSCGEFEEKIYEKWKDAGADRYLLKIETSNKKLYQQLHPNMSFDFRLHCLKTLQKLGYQTGCGMIVGLKGQTPEDIANDILFFQKENFDMIGINPFISHPHSMLKDYPSGDAKLAVKTMSLTRILTKNAHLPATTALASIDKQDLRLLALNAGANVLMPNFTPVKYRKYYEIYPNKHCIKEDDNILNDLNDLALKSNKVLDFSKGDSLK